MQSAQQLLQDGIAIKQVAKRCHYHSHSAFTTAFKNKFGVTPLDWLKQNQ
jgi:AraC-like DNA-binding protein